jgi:hypothetical protein
LLDVGLPGRAAFGVEIIAKMREAAAVFEGQVA